MTDFEHYDLAMDAEAIQYRMKMAVATLNDAINQIYNIEGDRWQMAYDVLYPLKIGVGVFCLSRYFAPKSSQWNKLKTIQLIIFSFQIGFVCRHFSAIRILVFQ